MKHDGLIVFSALQIDLDGETSRNRGFDRRGAVLDHALAGIVQAAMGDWALQPVELGHGFLKR
jgi:hypothetical protein